MAIVSDQGIDWLRKRIWLTPFDTQSVGLIAADDVALEVFQTAGVLYDEVNALGMGGAVLGDGEILTGYIRCPNDLDPKYPVGFRVGYTANADGAPTTDWILLQDALARGGVIAVATTALDTVIGVTTYVDTDGVASIVDWLWQLSDRGIRTDIGLNRAQIEAGALLTFSLEQNAQVNTTTTHLIGLEMDYVPWQTRGTGPSTDRKLKADGST